MGGGREGRERDGGREEGGGGGREGGEGEEGEGEGEREGEREREAGEQVLKVLNYHLHVLKLHHILITAHLPPRCLYRLDTLNQLPTLQRPQTPGELTLC